MKRGIEPCAACEEDQPVAARPIEDEDAVQAVRVAVVPYAGEAAALHQPVTVTRAAHVDEVLVAEAPRVHALLAGAIGAVAGALAMGPLPRQHQLHRFGPEEAPAV